jgi:chromodomain-helicase-DNA-binding protein 4
MPIVSNLCCLQVALTNVVMELRKLCGHPYLLEGVEPNVTNQAEANRWAFGLHKRVSLLE